MKEQKALRMSKMLIKTFREAPADADLRSHALMMRAGLIKQLASGIYSYMPMLYRTLRKIEQIMREEMDAIDCQEMNMPVTHSADLWKESGRFQADIAEMMKFQDRNGRDMVLAMTHEEVITDIIRNFVDSYKQLPQYMYHMQTKFRDERRARGGLIRVREFVMKDAYSFNTDEAGLDAFYTDISEAYFNIYRRAGLPQVVRVAGDNGVMGGKESHEYMYVTPIGEDRLVICPDCGYAANMEVAVQHKTIINEDQDMASLEEVATPDAKEIAVLSELLDIKHDQTIKTLIYKIEDEIVLISLRGDMMLNEVKLAGALKTAKFRPATTDEALAVGLIPGFVSPIGQQNIKVIVDDGLVECRNMIAGANKEGYHVLNVNYGRDYEADLIADVIEVQEDSLCAMCQAPLEITRGVEVGNIFKLGTRYSESLQAYYSDDKGERHPIIMGSYGIGVGRLAACAVEEYNDENGIIWPMNIAPYHVVVVPMGKEGEEVFEVAEKIADDLAKQGIETLFDDRKLRNGVKFNDLDLIGIPLRIVIGKRTLAEGKAEIKWRNNAEAELIPLEAVCAWAKENIKFDVTL